MSLPLPGVQRRPKDLASRTKGLATCADPVLARPDRRSFGRAPDAVKAASSVRRSLRKSRFFFVDSYEMRTRASRQLKKTTGSLSGRPGMAVPLALFVALAASAEPGLLAQTGPAPLLAARQDTTPRSEARLVSDVASVRPGEPFTVEAG